MQNHNISPAQKAATYSGGYAAFTQAAETVQQTRKLLGDIEAGTASAIVDATLAELERLFCERAAVMKRLTADMQASQAVLREVKADAKV